MWTDTRRCRITVLSQLKDLGAKESLFVLAYLVAMEKWLSVWHDTGGTDNKITAKCFAIGELDVNRPESIWEGREARGMKSEKKKKKRGGGGARKWSGRVQIRAANLVLTILRSGCLLWGIEQLLWGEDLFHLTLVFQRNSAGHLSSQKNQRRKKV